MPQTEEMKMDYEQMLEELASEYPELESQALSLKEDIMEMMPEDMPMDEPEVDLGLEEEDEELNLDL